MTSPFHNETPTDYRHLKSMPIIPNLGYIVSSLVFFPKKQTSPKQPAKDDHFFPFVFFGLDCQKDWPCRVKSTKSTKSHEFPHGNPPVSPRGPGHRSSAPLGAAPPRAGATLRGRAHGGGQFSMGTLWDFMGFEEIMAKSWEIWHLKVGIWEYSWISPWNIVGNKFPT